MLLLQGLVDVLAVAEQAKTRGEGNDVEQVHGGSLAVCLLTDSYDVLRPCSHCVQPSISTVLSRHSAWTGAGGLSSGLTGGGLWPRCRSGTQ
jgi:hypothetical protein